MIIQHEVKLSDYLFYKHSINRKKRKLVKFGKINPWETNIQYYQKTYLQFK